MKRQTRKLALARETIRILAGDELDLAVGGAHPTFGAGCAAVIAGTTSEADGGGPCPGEHSWTCQTG